MRPQELAMKPTKGRLARAVVEASTTEDLCAVGMALILVGCAKKGTTMQESVDIYRDVTSSSEYALRNEWDEIRSAPIEVQ